MTVRPERQQGLGRGLSALIPQRHPPGSGGQLEIPLDRIRANPFQPRRSFDEAELGPLVASIAEHGVIQPILVTEVLDGYQLVAGERRVRAARAAGLERIPAVVRQLADPQQLELALVENLQRDDLDPIEIALAFRQLITDFGFTQEALSERVGRARSTVANTLRLLELDQEVQAAVVDGRISEGHARAIGGLPPDHQSRVLGSIVDGELSVRQTEELVRRLREPKQAVAAAPRPADPDLERVEEDLRRALGTKVRLARSRRGGRIVIEYYSDEELGRLYERLTGGSA
ncbi:MAG TPA: ParB/RepB/Spo0J family partition protein [Candidatus Limnocylindrales bacterium]|nr:ParB/RepB/Spo0J family partition protein [Candidatus Limnocylindrales bacterium]